MNDPPEGADDPIDGFTVHYTEDEVMLTLSNRYGGYDQFIFTIEDAARIGRALARERDAS